MYHVTFECTSNQYSGPSVCYGSHFAVSLLTWFFFWVYLHVHLFTGHCGSASWLAVDLGSQSSPYRVSYTECVQFAAFKFIFNCNQIFVFIISCWTCFFYEGFNFGSLNVCKRKCIKLVVRSFTVLKTSVILLCGLHILRVTFRTQPLQLTRKQHMTNKWTRHILACKLHPTVWYLIAAIRVISN